MKIRIVRESGFKLIEVAIVVTIIGLLLAMAIPKFVRARATSQANACIMNLKIISAGIEIFARENRLVGTDPVTISNVLPFIGNTTRNQLPTCPLGGTYSVDLIQNPPQCNISGHVLP